MQQSSITCEDNMNSTDNMKLLYLRQVLAGFIHNFKAITPFSNNENPFHALFPDNAETELSLKGTFQF